MPEKRASPFHLICDNNLSHLRHTQSRPRCYPILRLGESATHVCGVIDGQWDKQHSDPYPNRRYARTFAANLNVGEPRTVRMIYFLPNDRPYRTDVVQKMNG